MGDEMPSLVLWVPAALVRLNGVGSSEAPSTWGGGEEAGMGAVVCDWPLVHPALGLAVPPVCQTTRLV